MSEAKSDDRWTVRGVRPDVRHAATAAADRADLSIGEWLNRAITRAIQADRAESRAPVPVGPPPSDTADTADLDRIVNHIRDLAAAGVPISKTAARRVYSVLVAQLPKNVAPPTRAAHAAGPAESPDGEQL